MTSPLCPPGPRNPLALPPAVTLPPAARSREALGLAVAASRGRFMLQRCAECATVQYPPRAVCTACLCPDLPWQDVPATGRLLARTTIRVSADPYFRPRTPWSIGTIQLDAGPQAIAHLHPDVTDGASVRLALKLDAAGQGVLLALPTQDTPHMTDAPQWRALTADPRGRRILVTDARTPLGQAMAHALLQAGARTVFAGIAAPWRPYDATALAHPQIETVALDLTDESSVHRLAANLGGRTEIVVNTALHLRPATILAQDATTTREAFELNVLGAQRLAQALGPALRARAADGDYPAVAWVSLVSAYALAAPADFGGPAPAQAGALSLAQSLRPALRPLRTITAFLGPLDDEWHAALPPPKLTPQAIAAGVVRALRDGLEEVAIGDIAQHLLARWADNPAILARETTA